MQEWQLTFQGSLFGQEATPPLAYDAAAADVDAALEALAGIDQVTVTGGAGGPWTITFGGAQAQQNLAELMGDPSTLTSGTVSRSLTYAYDAASQLTAASDPSSSYAFSYFCPCQLLDTECVCPFSVGAVSSAHIAQADVTVARSRGVFGG